jgi:hypothetical protein
MANREMPYAELWRRELAAEFDPGAQLDAGEAGDLMDRVEARYAELYRDRTPYDHPALRDHQEKMILPGLALYQVLRADGYEEEPALKMTERLLAADVLRRRWFLELLGRLPFFFWLVRTLTPRIMERNFPPQGWQVEWPDEGPDVVAFDITRCFCVDVLAAYGAPELTAVYCALDDLIYEDVSRHVRWERTRTLGRGDDRCDFRFRRV